MHIIYVPGLGDRRTFYQDKGIKLWRIFGLKPHYLALGWADKQGFENKLSRLLGKIDELKSQGHEVALVGVSAGASAVLAAYAKRPDLAGVICISGKINNPQTIADRVYKKNPDFKESMATVQRSLSTLEKKGLIENIMSLYAFADITVPPKDSKISGAKNKTILGWSHVTGIFFGVLTGGPIIARFLGSTKNNER